MSDCPNRAVPLLEEYFPGSVIGGKYRLEAVVGRGGMGSVWRATNLVLEMPIAIKLIHPEARGDETTALLLNEARLAAKLHHPSVVRLFDFGVAETGDAYIVMELLNGSNLADLLERRGKMSAITAVRLLLPIVHGLCAAHRRGIVHLDLKPENIVLSKVGARWQPKLLDFGIATKAGLRNGSAARTTLIGSPAYMSPEYACGSPDVDARSDVWGICVVLYELISGHAPFTAATVADTMRAVIENEPEPLADDQPGTRELWSILRAGLAKDRQQRFVHARQLGDALAQWLIDRDQHDDVCGEPLVSSWGPRARGRTVPSFVPPARDALTAAPLQPQKHRRAQGVAAVCLCVAASGLVFLRSDVGGDSRHTGHARHSLHGHANPSYATDVDAVPHRVTVPPAEPVPQSSAATPRDDEAENFAQLPVGTGHKPSSVRARLRLTGKATNRARSKEAKLGLKDPFE
jgi:eukaryotic-like serine/threonine-protein kinase